ncbi:MAG: hypothetical protein L0216_04340 [Planctomycetales bacterium]|nr:hypothetical protein [Planctomycetales bacterium]
MSGRRPRADRMVALLEKRYGVRRTPGWLETPLDVAVHAIVATGAPPAVGDRGYQALQREFVDWNEMRVATWREIGDALDRAHVPDPGARAVALKRALQQIFTRLNRVSLDNVAGMELREAHAYLAGFSDLPTHAAGAILYGRLRGAGIFPSHGVVRVSERTGLVRRGLTPGRAAESLEAQLPRRLHPRTHQLFGIVSEEFCLPKEPRCPQCPLGGTCETGVRTIAEQKKAEAAAAAKAKASAPAKAPSSVKAPKKGQSPAAAKARPARRPAPARKR